MIGLIFGDANPSGKLPVTYPRYSGSFNTCDHKWLDEVFEHASPQIFSYVFNPQYEFGHRLSYTTFSTSDIRFSSETLTSKKPITIKLTVTNTGKMAGKETIEVYSSDLVASITPSVKRLRKFQKIFLAPGEAKELEFTITVSDLAFVGKTLKRLLKQVNLIF